MAGGSSSSEWADEVAAERRHGKGTGNGGVGAAGLDYCFSIEIAGNEGMGSVDLLNC